MSCSPQSRNSPDFFREELKRALDEQTFGIVSYSLAHASSFQSNARVTLLEYVDVEVVLSIRGFQVIFCIFTRSNVLNVCLFKVISIVPRPCASSVSHAAQISAQGANDQVYESVEAMLQTISPLYTLRRAEALYSRLMV